MGRYLIDTNVISDYFSERLSEEFLDFLDPIIEERPCISVITQIELLSWKTSTKTELFIKQFLDSAQLFYLRKEIVLACVEIRRNHSIKIPDAIIASTAKCEDLILITRNVKDFSKIKSLKLLNSNLT